MAPLAYFRLYSCRSPLTTNRADYPNSQDLINNTIKIAKHVFGPLGPLCRVNPLTDRGKRFQLFKILCLTVIPILGVWGFTMYSLSDSVESKTDIEVVTTKLLILYRANRNMFSSKHNCIIYNVYCKLHASIHFLSK